MMDYKKYLNGRAYQMKPSGIRKFFDIVAERPEAISLGVGEPDFDTPWDSRNAAIKSIQRGDTQYSSNCGIPKLRELISTYYDTRYGIKYNPKNEVIVTVGASEGIDIALRALIESGDEILVPEPSYVSYAPCVTLPDGIAVPVKCYEKDGFRVTAENLEAAITEKTKALILPYPNNPTGGIMEKEHLKEIAAVIQKHDLIVVSDEIYSELTYTETGHVSIAGLPDMWERTIVINGFSKSFAMTGWRLGYILAPSEITHVMYKIHQYTIMCAPSVSQYAGIAALEQGLKDGFQAVKEMHDQYDMRRRYLLHRLNEIGLTCFEPKGAFYLFPSVKSLNMTGEEFALKLLEAENVAVVPGSAFGDSGEDYIRISYAYSMKSLDKALVRIARFVTGLSQ